MSWSGFGKRTETPAGFEPFGPGRGTSEGVRGRRLFRPWSCVAGLLVVAVVSLASACGTSQVEVLGPGAAGGLGGGGDGGSSGGVVGIDAGSSVDYCSGTGPPVVVGDHDGGTVSACTGGLA